MKFKYLWIFLFCLAGACADLTVYGPTDDYSGMANDFISESVKKNLRAGQPFGDKAMAQDAYARFATMNFDLQLVQRDLESANAICSRKGNDLYCNADRNWKILWPKPTRDPDGVLRTERTQDVRAQISYYVSSKDQQPIVNVDVKYVTR